MDDAILREAAAEMGDEFLNRETPYYPDKDGRHLDEFIQGELNRFESYLRSYITGRLEMGDFVGADEDAA